ncbi:MAG TPA: hypothetical protein VFJ02_05020 [Vicinamibacterales bacterium]|nr:hypothetical protein [Vicinamibacterales bacterium]
METEAPSSRARPRAWLLGVLGLAIVGLIAYWMWPAPPPPLPAQPATRARNTRAGSGQAVAPEDLKVRLEALQTKRPDPGEVERNPFRFRPPPPPPAPKPPPQSLLPPVVAPPQPPPVPPIPLKFMGTVEGPGIKLAALTDCKGFTYAGREGEVIDGRYRLVRIQVESIVMEYLNGTGRTTIRKSGECPK